jgi:peroxiredoxin
MKAAPLLLALCALPAFGQNRQDLREGPLKVGDTAPDFALKTLDGKSTVKLSALRGKMPVALVFGSYT